MFVETNCNYLYLKDHKIYVKCINILSSLIRSDFCSNAQTRSIKSFLLPLYEDRQTKANENELLYLQLIHKTKTKLGGSNALALSSLPPFFRKKNNNNINQ